MAALSNVSASASQTLQMLLEAFGEGSLSRTVVSERQSSFKAERMSFEDDESSGRPSSSNTTQNVERNPELTHNHL
jgi:hypothetical protein